MPVVWEFSDGSLEITVFAPEYLALRRFPDETTEAAVARLAENVRAKHGHLLTATKHIIPSKDLPQNKKKRDKWKVKNGKVVEVEPVVPPAVPVVP